MPQIKCSLRQFLSNLRGETGGPNYPVMKLDAYAQDVSAGDGVDSGGIILTSSGEV
jgi:hypothetical protein